MIHSGKVNGAENHSHSIAGVTGMSAGKLQELMSHTGTALGRTVSYTPSHVTGEFGKYKECPLHWHPLFLVETFGKSFV